MSLPKLLTPAEVCSYLNITKNTLYHWTFDRRIPYINSGGVLRFREDEILAWLQEHSPALQGTEKG